MSLEKAVAILTFVVVLVGLTMEVSVGRKKMHGVGPIQYELPESGGALQRAIVKAEPDAIQANTYFDFLFIAAYAVFFILAALLLRGAPSLRWPTAILAAVAGICDVLENLAILAATRMPLDQVGDAAARSIRIPSTIKWLSIFATLALLAFKIGSVWLRWFVLACAAVGFVTTVLVIQPAISLAMLLGFLGLIVFAVQILRT